MLDNEGEKKKKTDLVYTAPCTDSTYVMSTIK